jgi:hypothetical protein
MSALPQVGLWDSNLTPHDFDDDCPFEWVASPRRPAVGIYTDLRLKEVARSDASAKVAWLMEPRAINPAIYGWIRHFHDRFDAVFTFDRSLLEIDPKFRFCPWGTTWIAEQDRGIARKSRLVSIVASPKTDTRGQLLRHQAIERYRERLDGVFGASFEPLPERHEKVRGLADFAYSLAIENSRADAYFTEKIIDCFLTGTVPVYWGCPTIGEFFDERGIVTFDDLDELGNVLESLRFDDYAARADAISHNFERALEFVSLKRTLWRSGLDEIVSASQGSAA